MVALTSWFMGWPLERAIYLAPVIVIGFAALAACVACERDAALAYVVLVLERDRLREGEVRLRVARSLLLRAGDERRGLVVPPARNRSVDPLLPAATNVDEACALRGAEPFVAVAGIEVCVE